MMRGIVVGLALSIPVWCAIVAVVGAVQHAFTGRAQMVSLDLGAR